MKLSAFKELIQSGDFVILDTETTGLDDKAEICQIAVIDSQGNVLLDTLVKPTSPIPAEASRVHGILNEHVENAPLWGDVVKQVLTAIKGRNVVIYNADYDNRILEQTAKANSLKWLDKPLYNSYCAMLAYAEFWGESSYYGGYRWVQLAKACWQQSIPVNNAHNALADCLMTLEIVRKIAQGDKE